MVGGAEVGVVLSGITTGPAGAGCRRRSMTVATVAAIVAQMTAAMPILSAVRDRRLPASDSVAGILSASVFASSLSSGSNR